MFIFLRNHYKGWSKLHILGLTKLSKILLQLGFYCNKADSSLFIFQENKTTILFLTCIDDILIARNNDKFIKTLITRLGHEFYIKELGDLRNFLSVKVKPFSHGIFLYQSNYIQDLLKCTKILESSPNNTPMILEEKEATSNQNRVDVTSY